MTGTAATEAEEFWKVYNREVVEIPTNKPMKRDDQPDLIYKNQDAKYRAVVEEIDSLHREGKPVLVGTTDIDKSELLSEMLRRRGVPHEVLNAKQHEREAAIVAQAGRPGAVTVATNMAGRGTDIILGGNPDSLGIPLDEWQRAHDEVKAKDGLHIIGTERHEARRIDNQLRGRAGRQGDPGSTRFYVALDDELMRRFGGERISNFMEWAGLEEDVPIETKMISKSIESAQVKVEAYHFDMRKHLVEYDDVIKEQRKTIYEDRDKVLSGANPKVNVIEMAERITADAIDAHLLSRTRTGEEIDAFIGVLSTLFPPTLHRMSRDVIEDMSLEDMSEWGAEFPRSCYEDLEAKLTPELTSQIAQQVMLKAIDDNWVQHLTRMMDMRQSIGLYAYGQRDPLVMYRKKGYDEFNNLQFSVQQDTVRAIYHGFHALATGPGANGRARAAAPPGGASVMGRLADTPSRRGKARGSGKVGRNSPCPCGSGRKYKRCCGRAA